MPSFNFIAPYYDFLSQLVYGNNLNRAKKYFLNQLPRGAKILLMGGGTGAVLNDVLELLPDCIIDYIEPSSSMIAIAQRRLKPQFCHRVNFICGDHHSIPVDAMYDAVTSFFVLDCFQQQEAETFSNIIIAQLKPNGFWLFADFFAERNVFHPMLIWVMYRFFRLTAGINADRLPKYDLLFNELNFYCADEKRFLGGLIRTKVYKRQ